VIIAGTEESDESEDDQVNRDDIVQLAMIGSTNTVYVCSAVAVINPISRMYSPHIAKSIRPKTMSARRVAAHRIVDFVLCTTAHGTK
jgi:hypothetical protein